jgi:predicted metal-dependent phosphoesterase TrpH
MLEEARKKELKLITLTDHDVISSDDFIQKADNL